MINYLSKSFNDMTTFKKYLPYVYLTVFLTLSTLIILLATSPAEQSSEQSGLIVDMVVGFLGWFDYVPDAQLLDNLTYLVRKLIGHFGIFLIDGVFAYLTTISFIKLKKSWMPLLISIGAMIILAALSEIIQLFASGRAGLLGDAIIDSAGALIGISITYWLHQHFKSREKTI